jgi:hypothetical protein
VHLDEHQIAPSNGNFVDFETGDFDLAGRSDASRGGDQSRGESQQRSYKVDGKTVTESLPSPVAVAKAEREVAEFRNYRQLIQQFVEVNTQICELRPLTEATPSAQEKTTEAIRKECRDSDPCCDASGGGDGFDAAAAI